MSSANTQLLCLLKLIKTEVNNSTMTDATFALYARGCQRNKEILIGHGQRISTALLEQ